jgi:uracil-DNA glycosylase
MSASFTDFWKLLDDVQDYVDGGFRRPHPAPPPAAGTTPAPRRAAAQAAQAADAAAAPKPAGARPAAPRNEREEELRRLTEEVRACTKCALHSQRTNAVPGEGSIDPEVMVIGEGPGADEDSSGRPFVGRAGQYLDKWLAAISLSRDTNAYIANIVKCRPPGNRDPLPEESFSCFPYLQRQITLVRPRTILAVGRIAAQKLVGSEAGVGKLRGNVYSYKEIPVIVTYHPSGVLRNPSLRGAVWEDLKQLKALLDELQRGPLQ